MGSAHATGSARAHEAIMKALDSPLLNDNKITGAKNVLLLIVSGSQEITIDEIGEINDHIQAEAGHGANIIMGVGEDANLGEAIAVTVIATGFNIDQQDEIVNTESKKIIHTLEDEQKAQQDLSSPKVVHTLDFTGEEAEEQAVAEAPEPVYESELIPTTQYIRNFNVFYEEVIAEAVEADDFIMIDSRDLVAEIEVVDPVVVPAGKQEEDQMSLLFDMPLNASKPEEEEEKHVITFDLNDDIKELPVQEHIEVTPVLEYNKEGETRYSLEDYMELEQRLTGAKSKAEHFEPKLVENELVFEKKVIEQPQGSAPAASADPTDRPISEILKDRADERRRKLKDFNYKFQHNRSSIDEIEKEPAYKRQGVDISRSQENDGKVSRTTLSEDSNEEMRLRSNNSFLHDNVD